MIARLVVGLLLAALSAGPAMAGRWDDYHLIMWHDRTTVQMDGLLRMGFTGVKTRGTGGDISAADIAARRAVGMSWYLENVATDFYAPYHRYTPDKSVTWLFDAARARRAAAPDDRAVFVREPGLSDPAWVERVRARLDRVVRDQAPDAPLFYNLGDEVGIADLSAPWDFDIAPASLGGMRAWLRTRYDGLDALNRQWGTQFASWDDVVPELTDDAMRRTDDNYSAWSDFKAWMDVAFVRAVRAGTDAVHAADPAALSAIEGAQVPGWGGFDYGLLSDAVDVMDIYDSGNNLEIARSLNPALIPLRTVFATGPRETHGAWQNLLRGGRGLIVWDETDDTVTAAGDPGPRGLALSTLVGSLRAIAPALIASRPAPSPVAILYSQASFRTRWMLDQRPRGTAWSDRDAERELDDNAWRAARRQVTQRLLELGTPGRFVSTPMVEAGVLRDGSVRVLMLPHAIALSDTEVAEIRQFAAAGGTVLADTEPAVFDGHSRRRAASPLAGVAKMPQVVRPDAEPSTAGTLTSLAAVLGTAAPGIVVLGPDGLRASGVDIRPFHNGGVVLLALQAAVPWGGPPSVSVRLPMAGMVHDMRVPGAVLRGDRVEVRLDPIEPTILAVSPVPLPGPMLSGPARAAPGAEVSWRIGLDGPSAADVHAMRVELLDGDGRVVRALSGVQRVGAGGATWTARLPDGASGQWTLRVSDAMAGRSAAAVLTIAPP